MKEKIGWALIIIGVLFPIVATVVFFTEPSSMPLAAKIGFLCRFWVTAPILGGIGAKLVSDARRKKALQKHQKIDDRVKGNCCAFCKFADIGAWLTGQPWCRAPKNPSIDERRGVCLSMELEDEKAKEKAKGGE